jgi:uncharacterized repeat protein (TIGR01451 family)
MVFVDIYPAAHLVTVIGTISPVINVCDEFNVSYTVYNIGQADAWNTSVTLSVNPEGSVRIAGGETGYTQMLGTIAGYDSGALEQRGYATGTFKLHCKMACESTLTITPAGYDECGIHFVDPTVGMRITLDGPDGGPDFLGYVEQPGRAIDPKFLEPASKTVKQLDSGQLDLAITKKADNAFPAAGQIVNFTVTVTNNGPTAASGVKVTDTLPAGYTFVSATPSQGSWAAPVWTVGSIVVGGSASLVIQATATTTSERTNTASITAKDQPDPITSNNSASVILNKAAVTSKAIALKSGWNLISLPLIPTDGTISVVLSGIISHVVSVSAFDRCVGSQGTWYSFDPGPAYDDLTRMDDGKGYWINVNQDITLTIYGVELKSGAVTPPEYSVCPGWNLIGFKSTADRTAGDYLAGIAGKWTKIYGYANSSFVVVQSGDNMKTGYGYWIAVTSAGTIYP